MSRRYPPRPTDLASELPPISYVWRTPNRRPRRAEWDIPDPGTPGLLTPAMRGKLERIVRRAPEVMVKITGRTKGVEHLKSHLSYIMRNGNLDAETEQGATLAGRSGLKDLQQRWEDDAGLDDNRPLEGAFLGSDGEDSATYLGVPVGPLGVLPFPLGQAQTLAQAMPNSIRFVGVDADVIRRALAGQRLDARARRSDGPVQIGGDGLLYAPIGRVAPRSLAI
ncbi:hypothetical protein HAP41_0000048085 (plasmid) [Bradyrhizobium barranii subsp. apii]|uniref:Uncharacterized protein n=1 Tax=Bradyrhizobium barranii subsp. apii TaxID=2819348 RepID=A0A8T5VNM4_9BRAD|nr:hypothetical protein [Bradyrhizobium barranii]UPT92302.1 hypothetical protein HAP41_0000048085 [Bradyrhizobium barranii subsp. apii]